MQNRDKDLIVIKAQLFEQHAENKHLVAEGVEAKRAIKNAKTFEYNELTPSPFQNMKLTWRPQKLTWIV